MGLLNKLAGGLIKQVGGVAIEGVQTIQGDRVQQDKQASDLRMAGLEQFGKEFEYAKDGWFDSLMNGINRIPRPFGFFAVIGYMIWVGIDPEAALLFATNMSALPVWFQIMISGVIGFFYSMRPIEKHFSRRFRKADKKALDNARANLNDTGVASDNNNPLQGKSKDNPLAREKSNLTPRQKAVREDFFNSQAKDK